LEAPATPQDLAVLALGENLVEGLAEGEATIVKAPDGERGGVEETVAVLE
jgi:hypothetical protein